MKRLIIIALVVMVLPKHLPMFDRMIVRCEPDGKCHWECEFGVVTSTTMVNENLVVKPSGCAPKADGFQVVPTNSIEYRYDNMPQMRGVQN